MVNDSCNTAEEPFMRAVVKEEHIVVGLVTLTQLAPATRNESTRTSESQSLQYHICQSLWIIDHDTSKANVYWLSATRQESRQVFRWFVSRRVSEEEAAYICRTSQSVGVYHVRHMSRTYMLRPVRGTWYQSRAPAVSVRHFQLLQQFRTI